MLIIGLTGGIAMGKSTAARFYRAAHLPVFDADAVVHKLQRPGGAAIPALKAMFPAAFGQDRLDRGALRNLVLADPGKLTQLEAIMHPLVRMAQQSFLAHARRARAKVCVLDIPLLFETGADRSVDLIVAVSAPASVQIERMRELRKLPDHDIKAILARQVSDHFRTSRADVVVQTGLSRYHAWKTLNRHLIQIQERSPHALHSIRHRNHRAQPNYR